MVPISQNPYDYPDGFLVQILKHFLANSNNEHSKEI